MTERRPFRPPVIGGSSITDWKGRQRVGGGGCVHPFEDDEPSNGKEWDVWVVAHDREFPHRPCPGCGLYVICDRVASPP